MMYPQPDTYRMSSPDRLVFAKEWWVKATPEERAKFLPDHTEMASLAQLDYLPRAIMYDVIIRLEAAKRSA